VKTYRKKGEVRSGGRGDTSRYKKEKRSCKILVEGKLKGGKKNFRHPKKGGGSRITKKMKKKNFKKKAGFELKVGGNAGGGGDKSKKKRERKRILQNVVRGKEGRKGGRPFGGKFSLEKKAAKKENNAGGRKSEKKGKRGWQCGKGGAKSLGH